MMENFAKNVFLHAKMIWFLRTHWKLNENKLKLTVSTASLLSETKRTYYMQLKIPIRHRPSLKPKYEKYRSNEYHYLRHVERNNVFIPWVSYSPNKN